MKVWSWIRSHWSKHAWMLIVGAPEGLYFRCSACLAEHHMPQVEIGRTFVTHSVRKLGVGPCDAKSS